MNIPIGIKTQTGSIYTEIRLKEGIIMNQVLKDGEVFRLAELVPYQDGRIVNFDKDTGLSEHSAPREALIFALDGEGIIGYEGKEYCIKAGENFKFVKNGVEGIVPILLSDEEQNKLKESAEVLRKVIDEVL